MVVILYFEASYSYLLSSDFCYTLVLTFNSSEPLKLVF